MSSRSRDVADAFSAIAPTYDDHYRRPGDLADNDWIFGRARRIARMCPEGLFIDFGCGPGTALGWNVADPEHYLGIDLAEGMIEEARHRWPGYSFQHGGHEAIPGRRACSFILGAFGPLQYVHPLKLDAVAGAVLDALKPGGRFLLMARPTPTPTRVLGDDLTYGYNGEWLADHFRIEGVVTCRVRGHRRWLSRKAGQMSRKVQKMSLLAEGLYPLQPDACDWLVLEGHAIDR